MNGRFTVHKMTENCYTVMDGIADQSTVAVSIPFHTERRAQDVANLLNGEWAEWKERRKKGGGE